MSRNVLSVAPFLFPPPKLLKLYGCPCHCGVATNLCWDACIGVQVGVCKKARLKYAKLSERYAVLHHMYSWLVILTILASIGVPYPAKCPPENPTHLFLDTLNDCFLHQHIVHPTRYQAGSTPSILDLVFTSEEGMISNIEYLPGLSAGDHLVLQLLVVCYTSPSPSQLECKPALHKADFDLLRREASKVDWESAQGMDFQDAYSFIEKSISGLVDHYVLKTKPGKVQNLYLNKAALKLRKKKRRLWAIYVRSKNPDDYSKFATSRNSLRKMTRKLRAEFEAQIASQMKTNPKLFWRYANTRLKTKSGIDRLIISRSVSIYDPISMGTLNPR